MSDDVESLLKHQSYLEGKRSNWDTWWQQIAERILPAQANITVEAEEGTKRTERLFDSHGVFANQRFAAVMNELWTPSGQIYHGLAPESEELNDDQPSKAHLERINKLLFTMRYRPRANFSSQKIENYLSLGCFGNYGMFIDEEVGSGPVYLAPPLRELYWAAGTNGIVDMVYRKFCLTARNAVRWFGAKGARLPEKIVTASEREPFKEFEFLHCTRPNDERKTGAIGYRGMPFSGYFVSYERRQMLHVGGYEEFPWGIGRYHLGSGESYARSPAMSAWPAICTKNEEKKTVLRAGQLQTLPPLLATEDGLLEAFSMQSAAINYGGLNTEGTENIKPLNVGANVPLGIELMELEGRDIDEAFLVSIWKGLMDNPQMTATQALELIKHNAALLAPAGVRHESEDLGPMIEREIGILSRDSRFSWIIDEMPPQLRDDGGRFKVVFQSPHARQRRSEDAIAIARSLEQLSVVVQLDPDVKEVIDVKGAYREFVEITGMPAKYVRDSKQLDAILQDKQKAQAMQSAAELAQPISQAALNISKAESLRQGTTG